MIRIFAFRFFVDKISYGDLGDAYSKPDEQAETDMCTKSFWQKLQIWCYMSKIIDGDRDCCNANPQEKCRRLLHQLFPFLERWLLYI